MSFLDASRVPPRRLFPFVLLIAFLGAGLWFVHSRGGWQGLVKIQPILDSSTPRSQNGYLLVSIVVTDAPGDQTAFSLLVRPPTFPPCRFVGAGSDGVMQYESPDKQSRLPIQASALMSSGDITPLLCDIIGTSDAPQYLRIKVPGGYSNDCKFADITLVPDSGPFIHWRITHLPYMRQMISDSPVITDQLTKNGITVTAHAYRVRHQILLEANPFLPANSHQWEMVTNNAWPQFEKFDTQNNEQPYTRYPIEGREGRFTGKDLAAYGGLTTMFPANYRTASRFVRLDCAFRQFETYDEQVTFPNIALEEDAEDSGHDPGYGDMQTYYVSNPKAITLLTPSGLAVTLPVQDKNSNSHEADKVNVVISVKPNVSPTDLPRSPLVKQFGKPLSISVQFTPPDVSNGWIANSDDTDDTRDYSLWRPKNPEWSVKLTRQQMLRTPLYLAPPSRRNFTIILHERVDLQTLPMTFTVPVSDTLPPNFRW